MSALGLYNYWIVIFLMMAGFYVVISHGNLVKKIVGLNLFQTSVFILYISMGKVHGGTAPILAEGITNFSNPLPCRLPMASGPALARPALRKAGARMTEHVPARRWLDRTVPEPAPDVLTSGHGCWR